jgi:integrase
MKKLLDKTLARDGSADMSVSLKARYIRNLCFALSREIARAARRVLGRSVSAHVLRHSRATDLMASTHRIKAVSRLLGHPDGATTQR